MNKYNNNQNDGYIIKIYAGINLKYRIIKYMNNEKMSNYRKIYNKIIPLNIISVYISKIYFIDIDYIMLVNEKCFNSKYYINDIANHYCDICDYEISGDVIICKKTCDYDVCPLKEYELKLFINDLVLVKDQISSYYKSFELKK